MKNLMILCGIFIGMTISWSCAEPPVVFSEAQPRGVANDSFIFPIYKGTYFCESDSSTVFVKNKTIYKEKIFLLDNTMEEINDLDIKNMDKTLDFMEGKGDTIFSTITLRDTLVTIGRNQHIRFFKGHLVISKELQPDKWEVSILSLDKEMNLVFSEAIFPEDLERLESITPVETLSTEDFIQIRIHPSTKQFEDILNEKLIFEACDYYTRILLEPIF